ncbi:hypothetical protein SPOG_04906 [Schizosaccharomyces cryophilus OY26]|uniref:Uncharacterized protein n=1 Tax=Schizosaccharomyces cryophilus (strain OY26 / ATCC MYA-4695 / CBS 11777 / NBRC 106824 / NRRL Y48691) TaxID=653667 RepID=S9VYV8_SCHCR|nr:uncharacterized protein SPOG_04906 [Schizosaccharomyces cryophilus OY26]EPY51005.1 hypothetical protein SPOG_04906 [Schizosaccharomyces cryophilus OY26]
MSTAFSFFLFITLLTCLFGLTLGNTEIINFKSIHVYDRNGSCQLRIPDTVSQSLILQPYPIDPEKGISESASRVALHACGLKENTWYQLRASWPAVYPSEIDLAWNGTHALVRLYASFYSVDDSLMNHPPPVPIQIDLEPLTLGFLPSSLKPIVAVIAVIIISSIPFAFLILRKQKLD